MLEIVVAAASCVVTGSENPTPPRVPKGMCRENQRPRHPKPSTQEADLADGSDGHVKEESRCHLGFQRVWVTFWR